MSRALIDAIREFERYGIVSRTNIDVLAVRFETRERTRLSPTDGRTESQIRCP